MTVLIEQERRGLRRRAGMSSVIASASARVGAHGAPDPAVRVWDVIG